MSDILKTVLDASAATWIAIASLAVSIAVLVISNRRRIFDQKLLGEKKATELRSLTFEFLRRIEEFRVDIDAFERMCRDCELYPEDNFKRYREHADTFRRKAEVGLKRFPETANEETAILLEPITAYADDLCKRLEDLSQHCRELARECPNKKRKDSSEQPHQPDAD
ncbi:MAG: hypothetical protein ABSH06_27150 [Thermodesulfobacteriota bacterium]|jgi:hypothetical protein